MFVIYPSITEACSLTAWHAHVPSTSDYKSIRNELYEPVLDKMTSYCLTYLLSLSKKSLCITSLNDFLQMFFFYFFFIPNRAVNASFCTNIYGRALTYGSESASKSLRNLGWKISVLTTIRSVANVCPENAGAQKNSQVQLWVKFFCWYSLGRVLTFNDTSSSFLSNLDS